MPVANLVPIGATFIAGYTPQVNDFTALNNGPTGDSNTAGFVSEGGDETAINGGGSPGYYSFFTFGDTVNTIDYGRRQDLSATFYVTARISNIVNDTLTWDVTLAASGNNNTVIQFTETDTSWTTKSFNLAGLISEGTFDPWSSTTMTQFLATVRNSSYNSVKGSDNATFEIDEIWIEVNYPEKPNVLYWVQSQNTATWGNDTSLSWSNVSGGISGWRPPRGNTDAVFDANSDPGTAFTVTRSGTDEAALSCANLIISNLSQVMTFAGLSSSYINIKGSLQLPSSNFNHTFSGTYQFLANSGTHYINTSNNLNRLIISAGANATYELSQDLTVTDTSTFAHGLQLYGGIFNANNKNVNVARFGCWGIADKTVYMGSGTWNVASPFGVGVLWDVQSANTTLYANTSNIWLSANTTVDRVFRSYDQTYHKLTIGSGTSNGNVIIVGSNNAFYEIDTDKSVSYQLRFTNEGNTRINNFTISGTSGNLITLTSDKLYPKYTFYQPNQYAASFGSSSDISNNYIVIGAKDDDARSVNYGAVYVYYRANNQLAYNISASAVAASAEFGVQVAATDTYLIVSDSSVTSRSTVNAYYTANGTDIWWLGTNPSVGGEYARFGESIDISSNSRYTVIGYPGFVSGQSIAGRAVLVYTANGTVLYDETGPDSGDAFFGSAVATSNDYWVVGSPGYDTATQTDVGRIRVYYTANGALKQTIDCPIDATDRYFGNKIEMCDEDNTFIADVSGYNVIVYSAETGNIVSQVNTSLQIVSETFISKSYFGYSYYDSGANEGYVALYDKSSNNLISLYSNPQYSFRIGGNFGSTSKISISSDEKILLINDTGALTPKYNSNSVVYLTGRFFQSGGVSYLYDLDKKEHKLEKLGNDIVSVDYLDISYSNVTPNTLTWYAGENSVNNFISVQTEKIISVNAAVQDSDQFGSSVFVSGNTVIIGCYLDDTTTSNRGKAYIYTKSNSAWSYEATLEPNVSEISQNFGFDVAIDGNTTIVGAWLENVGAGNTDQGAAYVYTRSGTTWTLESKLLAGNRANNDRFGVSVAVRGDTAAVGSFRADGSGTDRGAAYVFTRSGGVWTQQQIITASDEADDDNFGNEVALSTDGNTLVVGAYLEDGAGTDRGAAYVFTRSGGVWTQQQKLTASDAANNDQFGYQADISDDTAVISAPFADVGSNTDAGAVYVFTRSGGTWTQQQKLTASDAANNDNFGISVAISGDVIIVGAELDDDIAANTGSAYIFTRSGTTWTEKQKLNASDAELGDQFGHEVAIDGNIIVIGANLEDGAGTDRGAVYVFEHSTNPGWIFTAPVTSAGNFFLLF